MSVSFLGYVVFFPSPVPAMQAISAMPPPPFLLLSWIATSHIHWLQNSLVPRYTFTDETVHLDYETLLGSNKIHIALYLRFTLWAESPLIFLDNLGRGLFPTYLGRSKETLLAGYLSFYYKRGNLFYFTLCSVSCLLLERLPLRSTLYLEMTKKLIGRWQKTFSFVLFSLCGQT